jgi:uncharacterized protein (TIGR01319 family)
MSRVIGKKDGLIVYDIGSTYTKAAAFTREGRKLFYIGRSQAPTTIENIAVGLQNAKYNLFNELDMPEVPIEEVYATSSAAGGLRMVAMGYMPRVTAKAAKEVAMSAGARVLEIVSYEDEPGFKVEVLREISPDIILLAGGTDGGDEESMLENASVIINSKIDAVVVIAGNAGAQAKVEGVLNSSNIKTVRVPNVMPTIHQLNVKPARQAIHTQFISQLTRARGMSKLMETVTDNRVMPTPGAVLMGTELLAAGVYRSEGLGDLLAVDIGGATTDVHSALPSLGKIPDEEKGLVVNNEKQLSYRTVEGNLGMRSSAGGVLETAGSAAILNRVGLSGEEYEQKLVQYTAFLEKNPEYVASTEEERLFDEGIAVTALEIALKRHAGYFAQEYNPVLGIVPGTPVGRDLRKVEYVVAIGGIFAHSSEEKAGAVLTKAFENPGLSLLPRKPLFIIDQEYLMYAIGTIGQKYPEEVLNFAISYLKKHYIAC